MNFNEAIELARADTNIIKTRKNLLFTFGPTKLPYLCLADSEDGVVYIHEGVVTTDKPHIAIPGEEMGFEGFEMEGVEQKGMIPVLLARGIRMPAAKYVNKNEEKRIFRGNIKDAIDVELERLDKVDDIKTGVITAPESVWKLSVLLYVGSQVARSAQSNVQEHMERIFLQRGGGNGSDNCN